MATPPYLIMLFSKIDTVASEIMGGLDSLFTSDEERLAAKQKLQETLTQPHLLQALTNLEEDKHPSLWVSGWRPGLGWLCVGLLALLWLNKFVHLTVWYNPTIDRGTNIEKAELFNRI
ncbi:hypothetical protein [Spartinivicinus ruber]|uniref:hypothetical protein n=1 Tax=Spartinivicinus ruber TaxID=2683272 RepID=UPI0013D34DDD|nr:hypothetical protein [Spartinivicinus ruber]